MSEIKIITYYSSELKTPRRGGGSEHSLTSGAIEKVGRAIAVSSENFEKQVMVILSSINSVYKNIEKQESVYKIEEFTISLAISAEGDIGLVSAGAEATIEVKFKKTTLNKSK